MGKLIAKIVLTGGPCAGKTTTISIIEEYLNNKGYHVLLLNECATETIKSGIRPFGNYKTNVYDFENEILKLQLYKESVLKRMISYYPEDTKIIILYDRGMVDIKGYLSEEEYDKILKENNLNKEEVLNEYDLVIHMKSVATNEELLYTKTNNQARFEEKMEAILVDNKINEAWNKHPNFKIAEVKSNLDEKIETVINYINELLKEKDK